MKKTIVVFGATGSQGGGLVRSILNDPNSEFAVKAITRDVNSEKAQALKAQGAEVATCDIDSEDSIAAVLEEHMEHSSLHFSGSIFHQKKKCNMLRTWQMLQKELV